MKLSQFRFDLPEELVATHPKENRDDSRLMVVDRKTHSIDHYKFKDIIDFFDDKDVFVTNNTKVFPARLYGYKEKTGAKIEVFLLRELNRETRLWDVLVNPARKIRIGNKLYFGEDDALVAEVIDNTTSRGRTLRFLFDGPYEEFKQVIDALGETPLPLERDVEEIDKERYQTIYASREGGVAAPTAGMHFSRELVKRLELKGIDFKELTLHTGLGNFRNIEVEDLSKHKMDSEQIWIPQSTVDAVNEAKNNKRNVVAIGTTVMKAMESSVSISSHLKPFEGWTNKFIFPPYDFHIANAMVTNFHMPKSPMMMLASAYTGYDFLNEIYKVAIKEKYKFFTYGDALLIK
ncbi:MAG: tRNA preQ1(34) S-adenosylmethionine ribosyltransferase-isomerase QueA [Bacteroidetes bacterium]|nr:MAG: tRNA preQ1(34) S-adenosylmethionine ribosyltransferase-isomerase QueA [Bacteroidota bacterium]